MANLKAMLEQIRAQADIENIRITQHAQQEMAEEDITFDEVLEAIATGQIWKIIQSIVEEPVVCLTVLLKRVVLCT